jgi:hypothetical protein
MDAQTNVSTRSQEAVSVAMRAAFREPQRPLLFALAVLIHAGLFQLLATQRHANPQAPERLTALTFVPGTASRTHPPPLSPLAPEQLPTAPVPEARPPQLIAPLEQQAGQGPAGVDWAHEAGEAARRRALEAEAERDHKNDQSPPKPKPEFGWDRSRTHRIEAIEGGGILVHLNDRCAIVITLLAMPVCQIGKKPARGDLFEHMDDAPTPGDWKDP